MDVNGFSNPNGALVTSSSGQLVFLPRILPPLLQFDNAMTVLIADSHTKLGRLSGIGELLPNPHILISPYLRREAVLSSKIEGTQASLSDLFKFELLGKESVDDAWKRVREVRNYVRALERGLKEIKQGNQPIDLDLVKRTHGILLQSVRGAERNPGQFRRIQVYIGNTPKVEDAVYIPPAPDQLETLLNNLAEFIRSPPIDMPILVQCAILHYQFEAVHPFADGNGRVGRLLIPLFLSQKGLLPHALLYISAYLDRNRTEYFARLLGVSQRGEWKEWIAFFLTGISQTSDEAIINVRKLLRLKDTYERRLRRGKATKNAHLLKDGLFSNPYTTALNASGFLRVSFPTAEATIKSLQKFEILSEITRRKRNRIFVAPEIIRILSRD